MPVSNDLVRRSSAALWRRRIEGGAVAHVFRNERGGLTHPVAGTLDLVDDCMMKQPVEQCGGDDGIAEGFAPLGEAATTSKPSNRTGNWRCPSKSRSAADG